MLTRGVCAAGAGGEQGPRGGCEAAGDARGAAGDRAGKAEFRGAANLED